MEIRQPFPLLVHLIERLGESVDAVEGVTVERRGGGRLAAVDAVETLSGLKLDLRSQTQSKTRINEAEHCAWHWSALYFHISTDSPTIPESDHSYNTMYYMY